MGKQTAGIARVLALIPALALVAALAAWSPPARAQAGAGGAAADAAKVVVQVSDSDPKRWGLALSNIHNLQAALGANKVDIMLVTFGPGVDMVMFDSIVANRLASALDSGVRIVACENTLTSRQIDTEDMHPGVGLVTSGVAEIVELQRRGWSYLRP